MVKAIWNGAVLAESEDTVVVENNHYFPASSLRQEYVRPSTHRSICPWKGTAHYYTIEVNGEKNLNACWYYPDPKPEAEQIRGRVAFWKEVQVS